MTTTRTVWANGGSGAGWRGRRPRRRRARGGRGRARLTRVEHRRRLARRTRALDADQAREPLDRVTDAPDGVDHVARPARLLAVGLEPRLEQLDVAEDHRQRIVDLVGGGAGQERDRA